MSVTAAGGGCLCGEAKGELATSASPPPLLASALRLTGADAASVDSDANLEVTLLVATCRGTAARHLHRRVIVQIVRSVRSGGKSDDECPWLLLLVM